MYLEVNNSLYSTTIFYNSFTINKNILTTSFRLNLKGLKLERSLMREEAKSFLPILHVYLFNYMIIQISNFGPIHEFEINLEKDLHLIYGKNAIGKSYAAYCVYNILKNLSNFGLIGIRFSDEKSYTKIINSVIKKAEANKLNEVNVNKELSEIFQSVFASGLLVELESSFFNTFSSFDNLGNKYTNEPFFIKIIIDESVILHFSQTQTGDLEIKKPRFNENYCAIVKNTKTTKYSLNRDGRKVFGVRNQAEFRENFLEFAFERMLHYISSITNLVDKVFFLPASRSGLYQALNAFTPIMAELSQNRFFIKENKIELPSLSEPLSDYFIDLSTIKSSNINKDFSTILEKIENNIIGGKVNYDDEQKKIYYKPNNIPFEVEISEASSMVSELAPILLFLRHVLNHKFSEQRSKYSLTSFIEYRMHFKFLNVVPFRPRGSWNNLIFIEEPEAHLHPEVQVKLMDVFEDLAKLGVKIVMTSHSNYMFNKLNNLLIKKDISASKVEVYHMIWTEKGSVVNKDMKSTDEGIDDHNFTDVSKELYEERINAYNEAN